MLGVKFLVGLQPLQQQAVAAHPNAKALANCLAQSQALMQGKTTEAIAAFRQALAALADSLGYRA